MHKQDIITTIENIANISVMYILTGKLSIMYEDPIFIIPKCCCSKQNIIPKISPHIIPITLIITPFMKNIERTSFFVAPIVRSIIMSFLHS